MKKVRYLLLVFTLSFLLTGCVKYNATIDIKKDKSMDFSIIYAFDTSVFGTESAIKDADKKKLKDQGFTVKDYNENTMKGITVSKKIKNIDEVSSDKSTEYNLSGMLEGNTKDNYIFEVKKGILKNTYKANFKFDASNSDVNTSGTESATDETDTTLNESNLTDQTKEVDNKEETTLEKEEVSAEDVTSEENAIEDTDEVTTIGEDKTTSTTDDLDLSKATTSMDLSFNVKLPYSAKSSNATTKNNDNKELNWNLSTNNLESIEFEFELYNMTNIYIGIGIIAVLLIALLGFITEKKKNNKTKGVSKAPTNENVPASQTSTENMAPTREVPQNESPSSSENVQPPETSTQTPAPTMATSQNEGVPSVPNTPVPSQNVQGQNIKTENPQPPVENNQNLQ